MHREFQPTVYVAFTVHEKQVSLCPIANTCRHRRLIRRNVKRLKTPRSDCMAQFHTSLVVKLLNLYRAYIVLCNLLIVSRSFTLIRSDVYQQYRTAGVVKRARSASL